MERLYELIHEAEGKQPARKRLEFDPFDLKEGHLLADYGIEDGDFLVYSEPD